MMSFFNLTLSEREWEGERGVKVQRISSLDDRWKIDRGEGKNSVGNVEAKELVRMTHGHELEGGNVGGRGWAGWSGVRGGEWDNCNSIINKYILKKKK